VTTEVRRERAAKVQTKEESLACSVVEESVAPSGGGKATIVV